MKRMANQLCHNLSPEHKQTTMVFKDVQYTNERDNVTSEGKNVSRDESEIFDSDKYKLDLYVPKSCMKNGGGAVSQRPPLGTSPVVIFVHGGGWRRGDRSAWKHYLSFMDTNLLVAFILKLFRLYGNVGGAFAARGITCAIVSYPLCKLPLQYLLFEMLTSYAMSVLFIMFVTSIMALLSYILLNIVFGMAVTFSTTSHKNWTQIVMFSLTFVNLVITCVMTISRSRYKLSRSNVYTIWILIIASYGITLLMESTFTTHNWIYVFFISTFFINHGFMSYRRLQMPNVSYKDQIDAIKQAIIFVKNFGQENRLFCSNGVYLMGHSAGGHLVTLLTLQGSRWPEDQINLNIQGVISISGVFDLPKLNTTILKPLYLHPAFGKNPRDWLDASPTHVIGQINNYTDERKQLPPFLLITAEKDLHLEDDAEKLKQRIQFIKGDCFKMTIRPSNHFTIVWDFKADSAATNTTLTQICSDFVLRTSQFPTEHLKYMS